MFTITTITMTTTITRHREDRYGPMKWAQQEAFEKCWAHSPLRAASRPFTRGRYRYCRAPPATTTRDRGDRYGPMEWAQWQTNLQVLNSVKFNNYCWTLKKHMYQS